MYLQGVFQRGFGRHRVQTSGLTCTVYVLDLLHEHHV